MKTITMYKPAVCNFSFDGQMIPRTVETPVDLFNWDLADNNLFTSIHDLTVEISCAMKELEMEGIKDRDIKVLTPKQIKAQKRLDAKKKREAWIKKTEATVLELKDLADEKEQLKHWLDDFKTSPENFMRPNVKNGIYDGRTYDTINDEKYVPREEKMSVRGSIKAFDKKIREEKKKGLINMREMMGYLASINEVREIVYNNKWGIVVRDPKTVNYPENEVLKTIAGIIMEGINIQHNDCHVSCFQVYAENITGRIPAERHDLIAIFANAPEGTVLAKAWATLPDLKYDDMKNGVIAWQEGKESFVKYDITTEFYYNEKLKQDIKDYAMYLTAEEMFF